LLKLGYADTNAKTERGYQSMTELYQTVLRVITFRI